MGRIVEEIECFIGLVRAEGDGVNYLEGVKREGRPKHLARMNYFGSGLVEKIGRERLESAPVYDITEINGGYLVRPFPDWTHISKEKCQRVEDRLEMKSAVDPY